MSDIHDVIIVGAGICGLTAALELKAKGVDDILILEADAKVGGRARSMTLSGGQIVDEGAHWFHGGDDNPFFQWARSRYDLGKIALDDKGEGIEGLVLWKHGSMDLMIEQFGRLDEAYQSMNSAQRRTASMHDVAAATKSPIAIELVEFMAQGWMAADAGASGVAAHEYFEDPLGPGGWQMRSGVQHLLTQMADDLGTTHISLNQTVTGIEDCAGFIGITTPSRCLRARHALLTVSPAVLLNGSITFARTVQDELTYRLRGLSMGNLLKIFIPLADEFFTSAGIAPDTPVCLVDDHAFIHLRSGSAPMATIFVGGQASREIEFWTSRQIDEFTACLLDKVPLFEGWRAALAGPIAVTGWGRDVLHGGSYSVCAPGHTRSDPFAVGRIFFSGEALLASHEDSPGQMAGAWAAGRKSAAQIAHAFYA